MKYAVVVMLIKKLPIVTITQPHCRSQFVGGRWVLYTSRMSLKLLRLPIFFNNFNARMLKRAFFLIQLRTYHFWGMERSVIIKSYISSRSVVQSPALCHPPLMQVRFFISAVEQNRMEHPAPGGACRTRQTSGNTILFLDKISHLFLVYPKGNLSCLC